MYVLKDHSIDLKFWYVICLILNLTLPNIYYLSSTLIKSINRNEKCDVKYMGSYTSPEITFKRIYYQWKLFESLNKPVFEITAAMNDEKIVMNFLNSEYRIFLIKKEEIKSITFVSYTNKYKTEQTIVAIKRAIKTSTPWTFMFLDLSSNFWKKIW